MDKNDAKVEAVFAAIRKLMEPEVKPKNKIGFVVDK